MVCCKGDKKIDNMDILIFMRKYREEVEAFWLGGSDWYTSKHMGWTTQRCVTMSSGLIR
jgi:hypothetical protein